MDCILDILSKVVVAEYTQWLRYTYLSSIGFGKYSKIVTDHYKEHASDELKHAELISRWLVDLGGTPPTMIDCVPQVCVSIEDGARWLLEAEIDGINLYQQAHNASNGLFGLQNDVGTILSEEHEHASDLMRIALSEDNDITVVLAGLNKTAQKDVENYLKNILILASHSVDKYDPTIGYQAIIDELNNSMEESEEMTTYSFYNDLKEWLESDMIAKNWNEVHDIIYPDWSVEKEEADLEVPRRKVEIPTTIKVRHYDTKQPVDVEVGTKIFNQTMFSRGTGKRGLSSGVITEVLPNGDVKVAIQEGKYQGEEQIWNPDTDKLWLSKKSSKEELKMQKIAVDKAAKDYWSNYFKEYGKMWVRDIPRRIKRAARLKMKADNIEGDFAPMGSELSDNGILSIEAAFCGKVDGANAKALITATFDDEGKMKTFECNRIV